MYAEVENLEQTSWVDEEQTTRFYNLIFGTKPSGAYVAPWTMEHGEPSGGASFTRIDKVAQWSAQQAEAGKDVYVHVGYSNKPAPLGKGRYKAKDIDGITALWADVDVEHPVHKKAGVAKSYEAARAVVRSIGIEPSVIVDSGHGVQAWWLLETPLARNEAATLALAWIGALRSHARALGCPNAVDPTQDLARVLRVAGTVNYKEPDAPRAVSILECHETRTYTLDDIRDAIARAPKSDEEERTAERAPAEPSAAPTMEDARIHELASSGKNGATYLRLHYGEKPEKYASESEADAAYVQMLAFYTGGNAEQMERMWLASPRGQYRKHSKEPYKTRDRADYRQRTIKSALAKQKKIGKYYSGGAWSDDEELETAPDALGTDSDGASRQEVSEAFQPSTGTPASARRATEKTAAKSKKRRAKKGNPGTLLPVESTGRAAYVPLARVIQLGTQRATYELELTDGRRVPVGSATEFCQYARLAAALFDAGYVLTPQKGEDWRATLLALRAVTEVFETMTEAEETLEWLAPYRDINIAEVYRVDKDNERIDDTRGRAAAIDKLSKRAKWGNVAPCVTDAQGRLYIGTMEFETRVRQMRDQFTTPKMIATRLTALGFRAETLRATMNYQQIRQRVFVSPTGFVDMERVKRWEEE